MCCCFFKQIPTILTLLKRAILINNVWQKNNGNVIALFITYFGNSRAVGEFLSCRSPFIRRTDAEAEALILWPPDGKNWLIGKDPDAGKDSRQEEKGTREDEMVEWHHWLDRHQFEQALGVGDGQGGLMCWSPWGHKESDTTEWLNWTEVSMTKDLDPWMWDATPTKS